ncbi:MULTISPECIES: helix-turn-helix domain-containing protein [unclassified Bradyrhizobium]|uniref:helix-turn-helix domain-containing protein n=1 Tax=unclassified Bradyrhizobium TaxID=2631580 RepID=UPI001CD3BEC5|nr:MULTISPECIES: helix-turn-helix domain-containing protein [unclassified Bradyrhizobium]MCA1430363.1 helix-turn-helix domain-containing protein [Bradyrhizobium sp. NBAIM16]MCA1508543.1 helix-turn-helix domain-containing protein [Bradyrhizobium sp. NBAIM02]MCA1515697.1 helix-turn-helix domain-containing protein [Bradyrhizobium sp. NBAIM01]
MQQIERPVPSRHSAWNTVGVRPHEQFAYYREAICQAFMNLTPEPAAASGFPASVEHVRLGDAAINRVSFPEHLVRRSAADIAASDRSCFYLNLKLAGRCRIQQDGREISLSPGQVGIFDSDRQFALLHDRGPQLCVASFWVPAEALRERLPASFDVVAARLSDDPVVGHLIVETARTLSEGALQMSEDEGVRLFRALIELVAVSLSRSSRLHAAEAESLADATTLAVKRAIHRRLRQPGLAVADVAAAVGISERYVHKLLARSGSSFTDYVIDHRLDGAARDLRTPAMAERAIGAIAFDWGFSDLSHFTRRFKQRFGCRPRDWRAR